MAARPLQPSEFEIQREVEALKDLRRRSTNPGALAIDPDLPNQSSQVSPTSPFRSNRGFNLPTDTSPIDPPTSVASKSDRSSDIGLSNGNEILNSPSDDPFHLFWVPASLHPEIAPAEFREFLKEHARTPASDDNASFGRSPSLSSSLGLSRKKSMLSRQYRPHETDGDEEENIVPLKRNRSFYRHEGPQLTISDLQKLEELAEEASQSDDPSKLRNVLRRSLSLNMSPTAILLDEIPDMGDDADAPIVVPPRDKALKRTARTKIRKVGLPGDGGGHRFASSRRGKKASQTPPEPRTSSDLSNSDHGEAEPSSMAACRTTLSDEGPSTRPDSYSEEQFIFDAYASHDDEHVFSPTLEAPQLLEPFTVSIDLPPTSSVDVIPPHAQPDPGPSAPILHQPKPQHLAVPQPMPEPTSRTPSPIDPAIAPIPIFPSTSAPLTPLPSLPSSSKKEKEKDKKGLFKWGDKSNKKAYKDKERPPEKESGFLSSLFGRKKHDSEYQSSITGGTSGREAAQALLGASKSSKNHIPLASPGLAPGIGGNPYARYPIHVERAIYRLSHIKLANPRRPLYEQVLISNLMFWYLGIINKAQSPPPTQAGLPGPTASPTEKQDAEKEEQERQQQEKEQRERAEKERLEKERLEKERLEKELREREMEKKKESGRRGSLTKSPPGALPTGGRRAEIPVKGPQYEMQHRVMEQEYGGYNMQQSPRSPTASSPPPVNGMPSPIRRPSQPIPSQSMSGQPISGQPLPGQLMHLGPMSPGRQMGVRPGPSPKPGSPQHRSMTEQYSYSSDSHSQQHPGLPPGAMPPMDQQAWMSTSPQHRTSSLNPQGRAQSPPNQYLPQQPQLHKQTSQENLGDRNGNYKGPMRSLSATASTVASPSLHQNGDHRGAAFYSKRPRTADSVSQIGEEEDLPLAVWQQRRT